MTTQAPPSGPNTERAELPTLATMRAQSTGKAARQHSRTGATEQDTDEAMTKNPGTGVAGGNPTSSHTARPNNPETTAHDGGHAHGPRQQRIRGGSPAWRSCSPGQVGDERLAPRANSIGRPPRVGGATEGIIHLSRHAPP